MKTTKKKIDEFIKDREKTIKEYNLSIKEVIELGNKVGTRKAPELKK